MVSRLIYHVTFSNKNSSLDVCAMGHLSLVSPTERITPGRAPSSIIRIPSTRASSHESSFSWNQPLHANRSVPFVASTS